MKYCFIINPKAGNASFAEELKRSVIDICEELKVSYDVFTSESVGDTRKYVKDAALENQDRIAIIACGGDGTLCETILAVMCLDSQIRKRVSVGVIPKGTGNDFVSNFEKKELFCDIAAQIEGTHHDIDLLRCNDLYSVNMINIGFDCHVVCKKEQLDKKKWLPRKLAYIVSLLVTLVKKPTVKLERSDDSRERKKKGLLLTTLANGAFCGGGFRSNPKAALDDGNIDCIEVKNVSRTKFLSLVGDYKKGKHLGEKFKNIVEHFKCKTTDMYFDEETPVSVDGEIIRTREIHVSVYQKALTILIPKGVKLISASSAE